MTPDDPQPRQTPVRSPRWRDFTLADYRGLALIAVLVAALFAPQLLKQWNDKPVSETRHSATIQSRGMFGEYQRGKYTKLVKARLDDGRLILVETRIEMLAVPDQQIVVVERTYESGDTRFSVPNY